jgi:hypothetical protein
MPCLFIEAKQRGIRGRIARHADKDPAVTHYRTAVGAAAELSDPFDVFCAGQIDFAMAIFLEYLFGSPFSVSEAILRDGCPPHDGQSAADAAVAETTKDKKMLPDDTMVRRAAPATIFLNPVAGCGLACILAVISFPCRTGRSINVAFRWNESGGFRSSERQQTRKLFFARSIDRQRFDS